MYTYMYILVCMGFLLCVIINKLKVCSLNILPPRTILSVLLECQNYYQETCLKLHVHYSYIY